MHRFWLAMVLVAFPALICKAELPLTDEVSKTLPSNLLKSPQKSSKSQALELHYGLSYLKFDAGTMKKLRIDHQSETASAQPFLTIKTAEAAQGQEDFTIKGFEAMCNSINEKTRLKDLQSVLSREYYQILLNKVKAGMSQYVVLAMLQVMRPSDIYILDFHVQSGKALLSVKGQSDFGPMQGMVRLVKEDGLWKIAQENWYAAQNDFPRTFGTSLSRFAQADQYLVPNLGGVIDEISPESRINMNYLALSKVPYHQSHRAFTFVFLMKKEKSEASHQNDIYQMSKTAYDKANPPTHMHVVWTGTRKLLKEQKVEQQYPINFSIANYDDGYSSGQWNLILPQKKPREVVVSLLWNF